MINERDIVLKTLNRYAWVNEGEEVIPRDNERYLELDNVMHVAYQVSLELLTELLRTSDPDRGTIQAARQEIAIKSQELLNKFSSGSEGFVCPFKPKEQNV